MLNMLEYACIYLNKQSSEYARILNVSDAVHIIRSLWKLLSCYQERRIQSTVKHLTLIRMVFIGTAQGWGWDKKTPSLKSVPHILK